MAVHQRNTASSPTQEPPLTIARVALYARVSTLNGQDPEMQLSRTPRVRFPPRLDHHQRVRRSGSIRLKGIAPTTESTHGRRSPAEVRCRAGVEDRSLRSFAEASGKRARGSLRLWSRLRQLPRQPRSRPRLLAGSCFRSSAPWRSSSDRLIQERVRAGLRNARAKGKKFGRPRVEIDAVRVAELRRDGLSWSQVCRTLNVSKGSAQRSVATPA